MADRALYLVLGLAAGAFFFQSCAPADVLPFPEVIVPAARIIELEPPARPPTIVERLVFVAPRPGVTARAPSGASDALEAFCRPTTLVQGPDTVVVVDTLLVLRSGTFSESWIPFVRDQLDLTGMTNAGDLERRSYRTRGSFDFTTAGLREPVVRYGRFNIARDVVDLGAYGFTLYSLLSALLE